MDRLLDDDLDDALSSLALHFRTALGLPFAYESENPRRGISVAAERLVMQSLLRIVREQASRTRLRSGRLALARTDREVEIRLSLEQEPDDRADRGPAREPAPAMSDIQMLTDCFQGQVTMDADGDLWSLRIRLPNDPDARTTPEDTSRGHADRSCQTGALLEAEIEKEAALAPRDFDASPNAMSWQQREIR